MTELPPDTRLRQYRILSTLGSGGFGITYLAEDEKLKKLFAIKEYFPEEFAVRSGGAVKARSDKVDDFIWGKERFMDEARTLARFSHPNIVGVAQIFEANRTAYMVLEYQDGLNFGKWLAAKGEPPTQAELDAIIGPIMDALETIHRNDVLHRDIAPDNLYIRNNGRPVLLDFGSAREAIAGRTKTLSVVKSGYSPAEQYVSRGSNQGPWTDIYSFAATLYRAVTGERPEESTDRMLADNDRPAVQGAKGSYRSSFLEAIDWGLQVRPEKRPQTVAEWRRALLSAGDSKETKPPPHRATDDLSAAKRTTPASPPAAPQRKLGILAYVGAFLLVVGSGTIWWSAQSPAPPVATPADVSPVIKAPSQSDSPVQPTLTDAERETEFFNRARGSIAMLKNYLIICKVCAHKSEVQSEIANIELEQRRAIERAALFDFRVCNRTDYAAATAIIARKELGASWSAIGWHAVSANSCINVGKYVKGKVYVLAKVNNEPRGWTGNDVKQCVEFPGPFNRVISKDYVCPSTGRVLGFFEATVSEQSYTWDIVGVPTTFDSEFMTFEVCNRSHYQSRVAVMGRKDPLNQNWTVEGWFRVAPSSCETIGRYAKQIVYATALAAGAPNVKIQTQDLRLCVEFPGPFSRLNHSGYNCRSNERLESFKKLETGTGENFTWNLN